MHFKFVCASNVFWSAVSEHCIKCYNWIHMYRVEHVQNTPGQTYCMHAGKVDRAVSLACSLSRIVNF
jgi:hypothetical protein